MKRIIILSMLCLLTVSVFAEQIFISKTGSKEGSMCQAVRIKDAWFLTAAHCVMPYCQNSVCTAEMPAGNEIITAKKQNIFWLNKSKANKSYYDIALINFEEYKSKLSSFSEPTVLIIKNLDFDIPQNLNRTFLDIGQLRSVGPVIYGPKNKIVFTDEFGLLHGLSGAGVMTNKGELISVVSAVASNSGEKRFSVFSVFDGEVESFFRSHIGFISFVYANKKDFSELDEARKKYAVSLDND